MKGLTIVNLTPGKITKQPCPTTKPKRTYLARARAMGLDPKYMKGVGVVIVLKDQVQKGLPNGTKYAFKPERMRDATEEEVSRSWLRHFL